MLLILSIILFMLMVMVGDERGVSSAFTLIGNIVIFIAYVYIIKAGANVYVMTLLCTVIFSALTLFAQNGVNKKTVSALLSVSVVMLLLMCVCVLIVYRGKLGGYNELEMYEEDAAFLYNEIKISSFELMTAVVLLSLLGAVMDTALSISTAEYEVFENNKDLTFQELVKSGWNIGKDILGTTVNTLFFAGIGESLFLMMLFFRYHYSFSMLLNSKAFVQELLIIAVSNIGCIIIIPLSSVVTAYMVKHKTKC